MSYLRTPMAHLHFAALIAFVGCPAIALKFDPDGLPGLEQRLEELSARQLEAQVWMTGPPDSSARQRVTWGCPDLPFWMAMPPHTATCTMMQALRHSFKDQNIKCDKVSGNPHDHTMTAKRYAGSVGWEKINSTFSFVIGKDPWSRVVSAVTWVRGMNTSAPRQEQIRQFRDFVRTYLPEKPGAAGQIGPFTYLRSISDYAYASRDATSPEVQVVRYVGKARELSVSMARVCMALGIEKDSCMDPNDPRVSQHHVSGPRRIPTVELFDDELRERVASIWHKDIERFGYKFGEL